MNRPTTIDHVFTPSERPAFPGSPASPEHPPGRRLGYLAIALLVGIAATFGNALVAANLTRLAGGLGVYAAEASWLPALYVAFNASANLVLVKARAQFGIPTVTGCLLAAYAAASLLQFVMHGLAAALLTRAVCGLTAAALSTFTIYNLLQVFPGRLRPLALVIGIGLPQLGSPLARLVPVELLALDHGHGLHLIELAIPLAALAAMAALPLPPSEHSKAFEPLDLVSFGLFLPAMVLVCGVLGTGRLLWWTDTPWLGGALAAAVPLLAAVLLIERRRARPLLQLQWLGSLGVLRFAAVAVLMRLAPAEQSYGAVGLLSAGGLNNDQLRLLFALVAGAMLLGIVAAAVTLSERRLPYQVIAASLLIAAGAWIDTDASNVTRPPQLYLSQALIAMGTTLFVGPAIVYGFMQMLRRGGDHLVSFVVLFGITQNIGGLAGSALLGSYQVIATRAHAAALSEHLIAADPQVVQRLQGGSATIAGVIADPAQRSVQAGGLLAQALNREASILAYNDVFRLVAVLALMTALYVAYLIVTNRLRARPQALQEMHR